MRNSLPAHPRRVFRAALAACAACFCASVATQAHNPRQIRSATTHRPAIAQCKCAIPAHFLVSKRKIPLHSTASSATPAFPAPQSPFPALNLLCAICKPAKHFPAPPPVKASFAFFPFRPAITNFTSPLPITAHSSSPISRFKPDEVVTLEIFSRHHRRHRSSLASPPSARAWPRAFGFLARNHSGSYREFRHRLDFRFRLRSQSRLRNSSAHRRCLQQSSDRWQLQQPEYRRYAANGEYLYTKPRWYDPFNRNKFKGDETPFGPKFSANKLF